MIAVFSFLAVPLSHIGRNPSTRNADDYELKLNKNYKFIDDWNKNGTGK